MEACRRIALPLVQLARVSRFASITQAVGERVVDEQLAELRDAERVHETFTALSLAEADPTEILDRGPAAGRCGRGARERAAPGPRLPRRPRRRGRASSTTGRPARAGCALPGRTGWDEQQGWLLTRLGPRERGWGRLVLQAPTPPSQRQVALVERGAAALALHRLHDRDRDNLVRRTHHELLLALQSDPTAEDVVRRCELAGFPTSRRGYVGLTIRPRPAMDGTGAASRRASGGEVLAAVVHAAHESGTPALISEMDHDVRVLLAVPPTASEVAIVERLATDLARRHPVVVGAGRGTTSLRHGRPHAARVPPGRGRRPPRRRRPRWCTGSRTSTCAACSPSSATTTGSACSSRGSSTRCAVTTTQHGTALLEALRALVRHPASKSEAAASLHLSRPAFYARLAKIESLLGARLDDPDIRVSLHAALIADELAGNAG